jgi:hypothetical protein
MDGRMAPGTPTGALAQIRRVEHISDVNLTGLEFLHLGMAFQAKIGITFHQQFPINRTVRIMANGASFPHGLVFEDKGTRLFAMALGAVFIESSHGQAARRLENIRPVRVVALHTIHSPLGHRMMLRQLELGMGLKMALKTRRRFLSWVDDEFAASTTRFNVLASRPMARFATCLACHCPAAFDMHSRMGTGREHAGDIRMTIETGLVSDIRGAWNLRRRDDCSCNRRTGIEQHTCGYKQAEHEQSTLLSASVHNRFVCSVVVRAQK